MVAVVGGRGVIGRAIVERLREHGHEVVVVTHSRGSGELPGHRYGDLLAPWTLPEALSGAEIVVQSANFESYPMEKPRRGLTYMAFDGEGTEHLVAAARLVGARRYVFISGVGTRAGANKPYWNALRRGEDAVLNAAGLEGVCIEPTLVFGPHDRGLNRMLHFARRAHFVPVVGSGREMHQPVFVYDVAELVRQTLAPDAPQGCFMIGGPDRMSMNELVGCTLRTAGIHKPILHVPAWVAVPGATILQRLPGEILSRAAIDFVREDFVADLGPTLSAFSLALTPLEDGLRSYLS